MDHGREATDCVSSLFYSPADNNTFFFFFTPHMWTTVPHPTITPWPIVNGSAFFFCLFPAVNNLFILLFFLARGVADFAIAFIQSVQANFATCTGNKDLIITAGSWPWINLESYTRFNAVALLLAGGVTTLAMT